MERYLRRLAGASEDRQWGDPGDRGAAGPERGGRGREDGDEVERASGPEDHQHRDEESAIADAIHDERLAAGVGIDLLSEPETDQEIAAQPYAFPSHEHHREVGAQHQYQHEEHEQVEIREVARVTGVLFHVADAEEMDQRADAGDDQQHHRRELIHLEGDVDLQRADRNPRPIAQYDGPGGVQGGERAEDGDRYRERAEQHARSNHRDGDLRARPGERQRAVQHEAEQRQCRREPNQIDGRSGHQSLSRFMFCRLTDCLCRKTARMMASPTAASAAATAMTKKTNTCPSTPSCWANATNVRLTAFNISSTHMKITIALRRNRTPATPSVKSTAETARAGGSSILQPARCRVDGSEDRGRLQKSGELGPREVTDE